jgi:glycerophosphoryl diester phosphodiesterase
MLAFDVSLTLTSLSHPMRVVALLISLLATALFAGQRTDQPTAMHLQPAPAPIPLTAPDSAGFDLEGHRGCRGLMPENTVPAFLRALELGVNTLELDVVISKDRQVVVSHEPYMNAAFSIKPDGTPVTKAEQKSINLYQLFYVDIKRYDVGSNGNPDFPEQKKIAAWKPLLTDMIREAESYRVAHNLPAFSYNIELKSEPSEYNKSQPEPAPFCELIYQVLTSQKIAPERVVIQSFDFAVLRAWKKQTDAGRFARVRMSALVENMKSPYVQLQELGFTPDIYSPYFMFLTEDRIKDLHGLGIKVIPWTVNKPDDMIRLKRMGVDGLITDYPDRAKGI